jgi:hypothetical protein
MQIAFGFPGAYCWKGEIRTARLWLCRKGMEPNLMTVSISDTVKRGKAPKSRYRSSLPVPRYLCEALYREAASKGVTVISLYLDILERGLSLHDDQSDQCIAA